MLPFIHCPGQMALTKGGAEQQCMGDHLGIQIGRKYQSPGYDGNPYRSQFPFSTSPFRAEKFADKEAGKVKETPRTLEMNSVSNQMNRRLSNE